MRGATTVWSDDHFVAGDLALDFANTVYRRWPEPGDDLFADIDALTAWLGWVRLLPEESDSTVTKSMLEDARALRKNLWSIFDAQREDRRVPSQALVSLLDTARRSAVGLTVHADGTTAAENVRGALAIVALRAIKLVLDPPRQGVRTCDRCGWFFIDSSRGRKRRWCSMKTCGNQAKAARHRSSSR